MTDVIAPHSPLPDPPRSDTPTNTPVNRCIANIWAERSRFQAIIDAIPDNADRILDVGVVRHELGRRGYGNLHAQLHVSYPDAQIIGIDTDHDGVERMTAPGYDVRVMDAQRLDFTRGFDAIVAGEVIEHLPNPGQFLESAAGHLTDGGRVILTTPNPDALRFTRKAWNGNWTSEDHTCWISPQHLERQGEYAGLGVCDVEYLEPPHGLSAWLFKRGRERMGATAYLAVMG